ncbi:single-stranded-DNA-specific exonuclease RecJ [gamma proteobacterium HTCC5015]|nr:single-stranded-DNA-specific exonuclease RecJ [gamma proteobacterium HTCC5015]
MTHSPHSATRIVRRHLSGDRPLEDPSLPPLVDRILRTRGVSTVEQCQYTLKRLHAPDLLGMERACQRLYEVLEQQQSVIIVGDYDADGATSTAVLIRALKALGLKRIDYLVPNRFDYGYGLSPEIVEVAAQGKPDVLITVDNGISSIEGVARANQLGIDVIVTDHHLPGSVLPQALAIVNPNLENDPFPSKHLAGVGVVFYLLIALRAYLRDNGWFEARGVAPLNLAESLDLVALGTVADVVRLDENNRILVDQGLKRIRSGQCCPGINALLQVAKRKANQLQAADLGFAVGPRLNAAGRLDDMSLGIECLLTDDASRAEEIAAALDGINHERRQIEQTMKDQAFKALERLEASLEGQALPAALSVFEENWHPGVVGIVAARVKERFHRPVIAFARESDDVVKGSARSIAGLHIRDALERVNSQHPGLIQKFGGHAMAAGLSLPEKNLASFRQAFAAVVAEQLGESVGQRELHTDGGLSGDEMTLSMAECLQQYGPWGQGFPEPRFDGEFEIVDQRIVGQHHLKMVLRHPDGPSIDAIAFNETGEHLTGAQRIRAVYALDINEFRGQRSVQLKIDYLEPRPA